MHYYLSFVLEVLDVYIVYSYIEFCRILKEVGGGGWEWVGGPKILNVEILGRCLTF